eukprot:gene22480-biopygen8762
MCGWEARPRSAPIRPIRAPGARARRGVDARREARSCALEPTRNPRKPRPHPSTLPLEPGGSCRAGVHMALRRRWLRRRRVRSAQRTRARGALRRMPLRPASAPYSAARAYFPHPQRDKYGACTGKHRDRINKIHNIVYNRAWNAPGKRIPHFQIPRVGSFHDLMARGGIFWSKEKQVCLERSAAPHVQWGNVTNRRAKRAGDFLRNLPNRSTPLDLRPRAAFPGRVLLRTVNKPGICGSPQTKKETLEQVSPIPAQGSGGRRGTDVAGREVGHHGRLPHRGDTDRRGSGGEDGDAQEPWGAPGGPGGSPVERGPQDTIGGTSDVDRTRTVSLPPGRCSLTPADSVASPWAVQLDPRGQCRFPLGGAAGPPRTVSLPPGRCSWTPAD